MKNNRTKQIVAIITLSFFAAATGGMQVNGQEPKHAGESRQDCNYLCRKELADARSATARYHDVKRAIADGFINTNQCVQHPVLGAMGIHFVNPARIADPELNAGEPEVLLYLPEADGEMRLVGLEYVFTGDDKPETVFNQKLRFNPARSEWALHAWVWRNNSAGIFADFNPGLRCPQ